MNTRTVDPRTTWTIVAMEAALLLPVISLPGEGDRLTGLIGPLLLLLLLPAGCVAVMRSVSLQDPSWRLLSGIGLALVTRAVVSVVPDAGLPGLLTWLARSFAPGAIGVGLWWRGGALAVSELTPAEVRTEFSVLAVGMVATLALMRPFLLQDPLLLGVSVGLFAVAGLIGTALSRQDAAELAPASQGAGQALAVGTALVPAAVAVVIVGFLRPELLDAMWLLIAHVIELILTPIGLLLNWLSSLLPKGPPPQPPLPSPVPTPLANPAANLSQMQDRLAWIGTVIVFTLLVALGAAALLAAKLLLSNVIRKPEAWSHPQPEDELVAETSGTPGEDAADVFGWMLRWLRALFRPAHGPGHGGSRRAERDQDAWAAYQRLLAWAETRGLARRPSETTGQLSERLAAQFPEASDAVDLVTEVFEHERYGSVRAPSDRLERVRRALATLRND